MSVSFTDQCNALMKNIIAGEYRESPRNSAVLLLVILYLFMENKNPLKTLDVHEEETCRILKSKIIREFTKHRKDLMVYTLIVRCTLDSDHILIEVFAKPKPGWKFNCVTMRANSTRAWTGGGNFHKQPYDEKS
jgi:hypothetical protein